jgi:16S rRNA (guanine966-N2)-methyltransferase
MRVIAGKYRGKRLAEPDNRAIRPTTDRVKEALFGAIQFDVAGATFLDLFSGSGALGIEALSRSAEHVTFVENDRNAVVLLRKNLENLDENYTVISSDFKLALSRLKDAAFDIVVMDPPYAAGFYKPAMQLLAENNVVCEDGMVILEVASDKEETDFEGFLKVKTKKYGNTCLWFYKRGN